jgi:hypothetical protein
LKLLKGVWKQWAALDSGFRRNDGFNGFCKNPFYFPIFCFSTKASISLRAMLILPGCGGGCQVPAASSTRTEAISLCIFSREPDHERVKGRLAAEIADVF